MSGFTREMFLEALLTRQSVPVPQLGPPGPSPVEVDAALDAALRAPDHGQCQPWRFRLIRGEARRELSELLVRAALARDPATPAQQLEKFRMTPLTAPLGIAVGAALKDHPKVPEIEQLLAVGAAVMNLLNVFHAQGYGAIWLTGPNSYDPAVARALGFGPGQRHLGFVYVGTRQGNIAARERPGRAGFVSDWQGPEG
jgi:nitroreductase